MACKRIFLCLTASLLVIYCFSIEAAASDVKKIVMASIVPKGSATGEYLNMIYTDAFKRLGIEMEYRYYPGKRASIAANDGDVDGEIARAETYGAQHADLVRVEESVYSNSFAAFTLHPTLKLDGWESLRDTEYRVEYGRGDATSYEHLGKLVPADKLSEIYTYMQGLKKLALDRIDILVAPKIVILTLLKSDEFQQFLGDKQRQDFPVRIAGAMAQLQVHAYLHIRHKELAQKLSNTLKTMKAEGLFDKYLKITGLATY